MTRYPLVYPSPTAHSIIKICKVWRISFDKFGLVVSVNEPFSNNKQRYKAYISPNFNYTGKPSPQPKPNTYI